MYCPNCGESNKIEISKEHSEVFIERGDFDENTFSYLLETDAVVLECSMCDQEFITL